MKLEDQVVSLELAKKLKELGVKQESLFYWYRGYDPRPHSPHFGDVYYVIDGVTGDEQIASAFTVAELGEMLPAEIEPTNNIGHLSTYKRSQPSANKLWGINYQNQNDRPLCYENADTEADARAKMLIYLIENNLITI